MLFSVIISMIVIMFVSVLITVIVMHLFSGVQSCPTRDGQKLQRFCLGGKRCQRLFQPGGQAFAHPDHQIGLRQCIRIAGAQREIMRVGAGWKQQFGRAQIAHDLCRQAMDGGDIGHHARHLGSGGEGQGAERDQKANHQVVLVIEIGRRYNAYVIT